MVKFLGLYDPWGSFLDFAPSVHEAPRACKERTTLRDKATGKGREGVKPLPISRDERGFCISARDLNALGLEASADDGKRRTAVLEVDVSPLRAK